MRTDKLAQTKRGAKLLSGTATRRCSPQAYLLTWVPKLPLVASNNSAVAALEELLGGGGGGGVWAMGRDIGAENPALDPIGIPIALSAYC